MCDIKGNIGIDIVEVSRFSDLDKKANQHYKEKFFSKLEIDYCQSFKESAVHFAGFFVAKEAVSKALGANEYPFIEMEIRHDSEGSPEVWWNDKKLPIKISISHTQTTAVAVAVS